MVWVKNQVNLFLLFFQIIYVIVIVFFLFFFFLPFCNLQGQEKWIRETWNYVDFFFSCYHSLGEFIIQNAV